ncbi:MAG: DinB family protein [Gemmatimonadaceae bacterium]
MTPDQALFLLNATLGSLKLESRVTAAVLRAVPMERSDYRPDDVGKTAMELVRHIAVADIRFNSVVPLGVFDVQGAGIPDDVATPQEVATWYEQEFARVFELLTKATPEQLTKSVDFRGMFQQPAIWYLTLGLHHTIHHRGQLSSYLRSMGGKVPAIYGESYDSAQAKKAATS